MSDVVIKAEGLGKKYALGTSLPCKHCNRVY